MSGLPVERRRAKYSTTKKVDRPTSPFWTKGQLGSSDDLGIHLATGYGIRLTVERGHLVVEDGIADDRRRVRFNRATSRLKRLVVVGHSGSVSLDAMRWIADIGAVFVQVDHDGNLVAMSAPARHHEPALRRAQALAADSPVGRELMVELLQTKLDRQAALCERIEAFTGADGLSAVIRTERERMSETLSLGELRLAEAMAGRAYWRAWASVPVQIAETDRKYLPEHWQTAGRRTPRRDGQWPRRAVSPVHAMLNYLYAVLEVEATIAAHAVGLDPSLGILHVDVRYRSSLAADLMEPVRPVVDGIVLDLLQTRALTRDDCVETTDGTCRVGPPLATLLSAAAPRLLSEVVPHAHSVARRLTTEPRSGEKGVPHNARPRRHYAARVGPPGPKLPMIDPAAWDSHVVPVLATLSARELAEKTQLSLTAAKDLRSGRRRPQPRNLPRVLAVASTQASLIAADHPATDVTVSYLHSVLAGYRAAAPPQTRQA